MRKPKVAIFGGGPASLAAAYFLKNSFEVLLFEKEKNIGQKFLVAGKGGFNLTNNLDGEKLSEFYSPPHLLSNAIFKFGSTSVREWLQINGIETFIGSSGRVFASKKIKPIEVLSNLKKALINNGVLINNQNKFCGFDHKCTPILSTKNGEMTVKADYYIFALGGASWPITGSDGVWIKHFKSIGIQTNPFEASNCGINIKWSSAKLSSHFGKPLKNIIVKAGNIISSGEAVITEFGLEGNAIYSVIPEIREQLRNGKAKISIDFKPNNTMINLLQKIKSVQPSTDNYKKVLNLRNPAISLIKSFSSKEDFLSQNKFIKNVKSLKLIVDSLRPIEEAISTVGGISASELNSDFSLKKHPNFYTIGEMVDWDAPTGGFLLQGCFSMGHHVASCINSKNI